MTDQFRREILLINARNSHVKEGLQAAYASKIPGGRLEVFCVSNKMYQGASRKGKVEAVQASGIPQLRRFCHSITARIRLLESKNFLEASLSNLLGSIELWANTAPEPQHTYNEETAISIHTAVEDTKKKVSEILSGTILV